MLNTTLPLLRCARCAGELSLKSGGGVSEIRSGTLVCQSCKRSYPILAGVALLVSDVRAYLVEHVKGLSREVDDAEIPAEHRPAYLKAKRALAEQGTEHYEEDLEAERVTSLYLLNHYMPSTKVQWWRPLSGAGSPLIDDLIRRHWDEGPLAKIAEELKKNKTKATMVELGCGVGGLFARVKGSVKSYLGVDSSFASVVLARHFALGAPLKTRVLFPEDLLNGPVSRELSLPVGKDLDGRADFIVCDLSKPPLKEGRFTVAAAVNVIDMLEDPADLPRLQARLLAPDGIAIQSCPYIWHQDVARQLRSCLPERISDSAGAVEWLYEEAGFKIESRTDNVPWLFFKHIRQLEIYSVHLFFASK